MQQGDWAQAAASFAAALDRLAKSEMAPRQRISFCAKYYAAVRLMQGAAQGSEPHQARLYRFAAALKLDEPHQVEVVREAVKRNRPLGNYKYCADQLTWLITQCLGSSSASMEVMARFQEEIDECDARGNRNAALPGDEDTDMFAEVVAACSSAADVDEVLAPLLRGD